MEAQTGYGVNLQSVTQNLKSVLSYILQICNFLQTTATTEVS